jgi:hypothetical protein
VTNEKNKHPLVDPINHCGHDYCRFYKISGPDPVELIVLPLPAVTVNASKENDQTNP